jgi:hypothetical protein
MFPGAPGAAFAAGADMKKVQVLMRHSFIAITADTYTSILPRGRLRAGRCDGRDGPPEGGARNWRAPLGLPGPHGY